MRHFPVKPMKETILVAGDPPVELESKHLQTVGVLESWHYAITCANVNI